MASRDYIRDSKEQEDDESKISLVDADELLGGASQNTNGLEAHDRAIDDHDVDKPPSKWLKFCKKYLLCLPDNDGWEHVASDDFAAHNSDKITPEAKASYLSQLTFGWFDEMMELGYKKPLMEQDLWKLQEFHDAAVVTDAVEAQWKEELRRRDQDLNYKPSLTKAYVRTYWREYAMSAFPRLIKVLGSFVAPFLLQQIIKFVEDPSIPVAYGLLLLFILFTSNICTSLGLHRYWVLTVSTAMHVRASCIGLIYRKSLRLSAGAKTSSSTGEVVNLMSNDSQRLQDTTFYLHFLWATPLLIIVCFFLASQVIGYAATSAGYAVFIVLTPFSVWIARSLEKIRQTGLKITDRRVKTATEIFNCIKTIKLYALEKTFHDRAASTRDEELSIVRKYQLLKAVNNCLNNALVPLISTVAFIVFVSMGGQLSASLAFSTVSLFNQLKWPFTLFNQITTGLVEAAVSIDRLETFLHAEEVPEQYVFPSQAAQEVLSLHKSGDIEFKVHDAHISIRNGEFTWCNDGANERSTLTGINLEVPRGNLVCIVGPVGSGKSSLINSLLGEINKVSGSIEVDGRICYAPQVPFLQHTTVRENILFGREYNEEFYQQVIDACGIVPDLASLLAGDQTLIGERGLNLSGGQKARIGLARAVYSDGDIYLLDDPLSAVDVHVGNKLFRDCILKLLRARGKIVVLVTHQLQYLVHADRILLMENGSISRQGSYEALKRDGLDFAELLRKFNVEEQRLDSSGEIKRAPATAGVELTGSPPTPPPSKQPETDNSKANKDQAEERKLGGVSKEVYLTYFSKQKLWWLMAAFAVLLYRIADLSQNFWLASWSTKNAMAAKIPSSNVTAPVYWAPQAAPAVSSELGAPVDFSSPQAPASAGGLSFEETKFYLIVYTCMTLVASLFMLAQESLLAVAGLMSGRVLYERMISTLMRAQMKFFDTTPKGRIMARVSNDTDQVDNALAGLIATTTNTILQMLGTMVMIFSSTLWFLFSLIPLAVVYTRTYMLFINSFREMARLGSISKAPIFSVFSETLNGLFAIRAFKSERRFQSEIENKININQRAYVYGFLTNRWLGVRMDLISNLITQSLAFVAIFGRGSVSAGLIGAAISYSLLSTEFLNGLIRSLSDMEGKMNNVERMEQYSAVETEPPAIIPSHRPNSEWPSQGVIEFQNVRMRYREGLPLVLDGLSFHIKPREKIGIVGRTGAGKSTLTAALFRLVDVEEGRILIDGIDISSIGVEDLRSKLSIIPQDPVIFDGSIRRNLDPSERASDNELWSVLQRVHLADAVRSMGGLDAIMAEDGANMSAGQKQLLCIGRALLRRARILLLDEASSSIDLETDYLLQQTIRKEFADCTVLTIAHRLQTSTGFPVLDSDRILVMAQGKAVEFDTPTALLAKDSLFSSMHSQAIHGGHK